MRDRPILGVVLAAFISCGSPCPTAVAAELQYGQQAQGSAWDQLADTIARPGEIEQASERMLQSAVSALAGNDDIAGMEADYPGLIDAFAEALRPLVRNEAGRAAPLYHNDLAALYAANLTENEARQTMEFMRSPPMERFRKTVMENNSMRSTARDIAKGEDVSTESISADMRTAGLNSVLLTDGSDMKAIQAFYVTPLGQKFAALNPRKIEIDQKWANYISPGAESQIPKVVLETMVAHIAKTDLEMAKTLRKELVKEFGE